MNLNSLGDGVFYLAQSRTNTQLKTDLNRLTNQLSSGEIADKAKALKGDTARFSAIDHGLATLEPAIARNRETALLLDTMQRTLDGLNIQREAMAEDLTKINRESPDLQVDDAASNALSRFEAMVSTLNTEVAGKRLFAGTAVDGPALASAEDMLADLVTAVGGTTDFQTIEFEVNAWFNDAGGGFETVGYLGDTGNPMTRRLDENRNATIEARADNAEIRETLKGAAMAALADALPGIGKQTKTALLFEGGLRLQSAAAQVVNMQAKVGFLENEVDRAITFQTAQQTSLSQARNDMANDDPFETATALQALQVQLETHYQMTARLARLSLAEYI